MFTGELRLPKIDTADRRPLVQSERTFLEAVFARPETGRPLMILAQADINTQIYGRALRHQAETLYGADNVFHIFPPNSSRADSAAYFGRLAKQCHLEGDIAESWHWAEALSGKLDSGQEVFLLVTGFENGPEESRGELAGELRQLNERYPALRVVMMGGERLAALKYASGSMSLLNIAEELPIPQLTHRDLHDLFGQQYRQLNLSPSNSKPFWNLPVAIPACCRIACNRGRIPRRHVNRCYDNRRYLPNCSRASTQRRIACHSVPC